MPVFDHDIGTNTSGHRDESQFASTSSGSLKSNPPRDSRVSSSNHTTSHEHGTASPLKARRIDRISGTVSKRLDKMKSSCPIPESYSSPRKPLAKRMYIDIVTPRATRVPSKKPTSKGEPHAPHRIPLGDKSAPNTPSVEHRAFISIPTKAVGTTQMKHRKPISRRSSLSKGLFPSPAQLKAPQKVEVIDLDSEGETSM